jgi:hypothetical protein
LDGNFGEELTTIRKNGEIIEHYSITLSIKPHLFINIPIMQQVKKGFLNNNNYLEGL